MATTTLTEIIPLRMDKDGVIRVSKTRVTLHTIVAAFTEGATAEEIAYQYPTVPLADIYSVIGYYLHRKKRWIHILNVEQNLQSRYENKMRQGLTKREYAKGY